MFIKAQYPFKEGETYYTIEKDQLVKSTWDDQSEEMHEPNKQYFKSIDDLSIIMQQAVDHYREYMVLTAFAKYVRERVVVTGNGYISHNYELVGSFINSTEYKIATESVKEIG